MMLLKCNDNDGQCRTAASKLQIRLNDLINRHKAPLQMYDDVDDAERRRRRRTRRRDDDDSRRRQQPETLAGRGGRGGG